MPQTKRDYYEVLGLSKGVSIGEIKSAYKKLAKKFHPDVSKEENAEEKFKEAMEAYSVLSDPQKKSNYDQFGHAASGFSGFRGFSGFDQSKGFASAGFDFEDLFGGFGDIFGFQRNARHAPRRGVDLRYDLSISFEEAAFGTEKKISIERIDSCNECNGTGSKSGERIQCPDCRGTGSIQMTRNTFFGTIATRTTCQKCSGSGKTVKEACKKCNGTGKIRKKRALDIKIPEGIRNGTYLRLKQEGNAGDHGAEAGDLFVVMFVEPHEMFKRDENDVFIEVPLTFSQAALGSEMEVPTLKGMAKLRVPEGTQSETIFKMKGRGIKDLQRGGYGDQYVKAMVRTPQKLSKQEKDLLRELGKGEPGHLKDDSFVKRFRKKFKKS